jgi:uncharacterized membrane protein
LVYIIRYPIYEEIRANAPMVYIIRFYFKKILGLRPFGLYHSLSYYEDIKANAPLVYIIRYPIYEEIRANAPMVYIIRFYFKKILGLRPFGLYQG